MSVVLIVRRFGHAAWRVWKAGQTCADPMKMCQKPVVPEMGKEFPELAASERAWVRLASPLQHYGT